MYTAKRTGAPCAGTPVRSVMDLRADQLTAGALATIRWYSIRAALWT